MEFVDAIQRGEPPANPTRIVQASIASDNKPVPARVVTPPAQTITAEELSASKPSTK
jgi:peptidylprolyl isomerase